MCSIEPGLIRIFIGDIVRFFTVPPVVSLPAGIEADFIGRVGTGPDVVCNTVTLSQAPVLGTVRCFMAGFIDTLEYTPAVGRGLFSAESCELPAFVRPVF